VNDPSKQRPCAGLADGSKCPETTSGRYSLYCSRCRSIRRRKPIKYIWTPEKDEILRVCWDGMHHQKSLSVAVKRTGFPKDTVKARAQRLGLSVPRKKEPAWSSAELEILERNSWKDPAVICAALKKRGFSRTVVSVVVKRKRLRLLADLEGYTTSQLEDLLGVDRKTISRWIDKKLLTAHFARDKWFIHRDAIRLFILRNPDAFSFGRVDRHWLVTLLAGDLAMEAAMRAGEKKSRPQTDEDDD
jgi:transposase